jgi:predicted GNAT family N-acyltransferase
MFIRTAITDDLKMITAVEQECFPPSQAASEDLFRDRLRLYPDHFLLLFDGDRLVSFLDGFTTDEEDLSDRMYDDAYMHDENGAWQMIFGVNTIPSYRQRGCAALLIKQAIAKASREGRKGLVLTCKKELIEYYSRFGFVNEGVTELSVKGGVCWYQMRLLL